MPASTPMMPRTPLEEHRPGVPLRSIETARRRFLEAVRVNVPAVLIDLAGEPLEAMRPANMGELTDGPAGMSTRMQSPTH